MFDAAYPPSPSPPLPPRPAPLDVRAVLPLLRVEAEETAVALLATAAAENAIAMVRWAALNWGPAADLRDHAHPAHVAAQAPGSPPWRLAEAQDALRTACWRYRVATGHDGLALARETVARDYGPTVAAYALKPLIAAAEDWREIDDALMSDSPEPLPPEPAPTPHQRQVATQALAAWGLSDPRMGALPDRLAALLRRDDGALVTVRRAIADSLARGVEPERLQIALNLWTVATGGPRIALST